MAARATINVRCNADTPAKIAELAMELGYFYIGKDSTRCGSAGALMDAIASGRIKLTASEGA